MSEKFRVARYKASKLQSHFAHGFFSLIPVPLKGLGTCGVDEKHHFYYDPDVCEKWSNEDWITGIFHELWHLLLDHKKRGERFAGESPAAKTRWNICGDLELAQHIKEAQLKFLETDLTPDKFGLPWGLTAEEYWHLLPAATKDSSNCGSGSGGTSYEGEIKGEGISSFEAAAVRKTVAEAIKKIGNAPGGLSRWADSVLSPKVNWKEQLKAVVCRQLRDIGTKNQQNSWLRLNRRQALFGKRPLVPGKLSYKIRVGVVVDTSGSMEKKQLAQALAETGSLLRECEVLFASCDAKSTEPKKLASMLGAELIGGGGTDMGKGIEAFQKSAIDLLIIFTDGATPWPPEAPSFPVVVCLLDKELEVPKWAKKIVVS